MRKLKAFTLIELLTVMAITGVLLTLIVLPIFQTFNLTRTAQAFADAQDKARLLVEKISREVGNAVSVRDSADTTARIPAVDANNNPIPGSFVDINLPYTKLDLISPAQGDPADKDPVSGAYRNPKTGKFDPTLTRPIGDIRLPVSPGMTITRWWIGLNNPLAPYNEPYTGLLMARGGGRDNLFVLRRAEVQPFVYRPRKDGIANSTAWRPNLAYFHSDDARPSGGEFDTRIIDLDDAMFFVRDGQYLPEGGTRVDDLGGAGTPGKNDRVDNWTTAGVVQTELSRYDMIRPLVQGSPPKVVKDASGRTTVVPLVQFRPSRVGNASATAGTAAKPGDAVEGLDRIGADTYQTERGLWTNAVVRYYPSAFAPGAVEIASVNQLGGVTISNGGYDASGLDSPGAYALFDLQLYERMVGRGELYPFTQGARSADLVDNWTSVEGMRRLFTPFRVLTASGKIVTSFPVEEVGFNALTGGRPRPNLPFVTTSEARSPAFDNGAGALLSPLSDTMSVKYDVNHLFNYLWNAYPAFQGSWQRFVDLRFVPNEDGTYSPLNPNAAAGSVTGFSFPLDAARPARGSLNRVRIVPGSDEVYGPDQTTGASYGTIVRYMRVASNPGPNQYRLIYTDLPEPTNGAGDVDYTVLGYPTAGPGFGGFDPLSYNKDNILSAVVQPRYKAGYLQLCSDANVPIPAREATPLDAFGVPIRPGTITVKYRFQFNGPDDSFVVDHDTREVMQILLTIKNYPQSSVPNAQTVTLKSTATLRNALR